MRNGQNAHECLGPPRREGSAVGPHIKKGAGSRRRGASAWDPQKTCLVEYAWVDYSSESAITVSDSASSEESSVSVDESLSAPAPAASAVLSGGASRDQHTRQ